MKRIDARTVEFTTNAEVYADEQFDALLDDGKGIPEAAMLAINDALDRFSSPISEEFVEYLSEDTCVKVRGRVIIRPDWATRMRAQR